MNIQTFIVGILFILILVVALMIVLVGMVGVLRIMIISVFEFDFVKWWKSRETKKDGESVFKKYYKLTLKRSEDDSKHIQ